MGEFLSVSVCKLTLYPLEHLDIMISKLLKFSFLISFVLSNKTISNDCPCPEGWIDLAFFDMGNLSQQNLQSSS